MVPSTQITTTPINREKYISQYKCSHLERNDFQQQETHQVEQVTTTTRYSTDLALADYDVRT